MKSVIGQPCVIGVGYQGQTIDQFVNSLEDMHITCVIDVRLTPLSRKPGLARTLTSRGISYEHARELGNPKDNREGFAGDEQQLEAARLRRIAATAMFFLRKFTGGRCEGPTSHPRRNTT